MEKYMLQHSNGEKKVYEVFDKFDFIQLLSQIDYFIKSWKYNAYEDRWEVCG